MKKIICLLITVALLVPATAFADASFSDLPAGHWAYAYVNKLVNDKTVNGYEDGTFKPDAKVTRAEFVKMIGKSAETAANDFTDVPKDHWGYDYIMSSGMDVEGTAFRPDDLMTRNDVAALVWKRAGSVAGLKAAPNVTDGFTNKDAAAWVYTYGIMNGDDGINLRPADGITRAEAAAIICRSREVSESTAQVNFIDKISEDTLQTIFDSSHLFDSKYSADAKITNGELARAGIRFIFNEYTPSFGSFVTKSLFDSEYAREMYILGAKVLGKEYVSEEYTSKNATVKDAIAYFAYGCSQKTLRAINYGGKDSYYPDITDTDLTENENMALTFAYNEGVTIYANAKINPYNEITHKEMAVLLIQFDNLVGINNSHYVSDRADTRVQSMLRTGVDGYPSNKADFGFIIEDIPNKVYEAPFVNNSGKPVNCYKFVMDYSSIFADYAKNLCAVAFAKTGSSVSITFNPSMIYKADLGYTIRAKITVLNSEIGVSLKDIIPPADGVNADIMLNIGDYVYCDFNTGIEVTDIVIPTAYTTITQVIE